MNIFASYSDPELSAQILDDKRVIKMILESTQMLCTALSDYGYQSPYKTTHKNHPCTIWVRESSQNADWLMHHANALSREYTKRYGKVHKCTDILSDIKNHIKLLPDTPFKDPPNCAKRTDLNIDFTHLKDVYKAYRNYIYSRWLLEYNKPRVSPSFYRSKQVIKVRLTKIQSSHHKMRTENVEGLTHNLPVVGSSFLMYAPALEDGDIRYIRTSTVQNVHYGKENIIFDTENSRYTVNVI